MEPPKIEELVLAIESNDLKTVKQILDFVNEDGEFLDPRISNNLIFIHASKQGFPQIVKLFLEWKGPNGEFIDPRDQENKALNEACMDGYTEIVKMLLEWKGPDGEYIDAAYPYNEPLINACAGGYSNIVKLLLEWIGQEDEIIDPREPEILALTNAIRSGSVEITKMLLKWKGPNNETVELSDYFLEIELASGYGHTEIVKVLIEWYSNHNIELNEVFKYLVPAHRKYLLVYYPIDEIPENKYNFYVNYNTEADKLFVEYILLKYPQNKDKILRLLRLSDKESIILKSISASQPYKISGAVGKIGSIISDYLL